VQQQLQDLLGQNSARMVDSMMKMRRPGDSMMATFLGAAGLVIGATGVFGQLQDSLNTIWRVTPKPGHGIWLFVRDRFLSMAMVLGIGFLLLVSMVLTTLINAFARQIGDAFSLPAWVAPVFNDFVSLVVISVLFAAIFKILPDVKMRWKDVWPGAIVTALLFTIGKYLLGLYLGRAVSASVYGAGSAFIMILAYVYYSSVILFFGAEFTRVEATRRGAKIEPSKYAVYVSAAQRTKEGLPDPALVEAAARQRDKAACEPAASQQPTEPYRHPGRPSAPTGSPKTSGQRMIRPSPEPVAAQSWPLVGLAVAFGVAAGFLFRFRTARKWLRLAQVNR
jgi:membrane protein